MQADTAFRSAGRAFLRDRWIYLFLLPSVGFFALYTVWPLIATIRYSFYDWSGYGADATFIGLANYRELLSDPLFWNAYGNTWLFVVITVPTRVFLALLLAIALNSPRLPFRNLLRTAFFIPVVTTAAIVGLVMTLVLQPTGGPVDLLAHKLDLVNSPVNLLGHSSTALLTTMGVWVWKWLGVTIVYWLAALQTIPPDVREAARLDGCGRFQEFRTVTLPLLVPFTLIITLITILDALNIFDLLQTLTGGGPAFSSEVIEVFIYRNAFAETIPRQGYASAAAVFFGLTCLIVGVVLQVARVIHNRVQAS